MPMITLNAHFDGERIRLDEPFNLKPDMKLIVTVVPNQIHDQEHDSWLQISGQMLENAYGENEPEYSSDLLKEINPHYETI